jgi:signal transduction histidine kinase
MGKPLKIEIGSLSNSDGTILFVKDDGVGMDPSLQRRIFEPFYRDRDGKGSSMGLALSRRIIEVHGGRMWIESELDKGCAIFFTLPVVGS